MQNQLNRILPWHRKLYSRHLMLRRLGRKDARELYRLITENRDYLRSWMPPFPDRINCGLIEEWLAEDQKLMRRGERIDLGILSLDGSQLLGRVALHSIKWGIQRSASISYWLSQKSTGSGFSTEAVATLISFAFEELQLHRILAEISPDNKPSLAVVAKLGFRNEGLNVKSLFLNSCWQDTCQMALLEEEYDQLAESWIRRGILGV
ncbi:MAG: GNAT family N-acetyltransferase [Candidatus Rifleibacteriota bacterium]